ncbi:uncharacterized protein METZ01_LOCUS254757, partial [marine metagenome]
MSEKAIRKQIEKLCNDDEWVKSFTSK